MDKTGATLELPRGKTYELKVDNNCPYVDKEVLAELMSLRRRTANRRRRWRTLQTAWAAYKVHKYRNWMSTGGQVIHNTPVIVLSAREVQVQLDRIIGHMHVWVVSCR